MAGSPKSTRRSDEPVLWKVFHGRGCVQILVLLAERGPLRTSEIDREIPEVARKIVGDRLRELRGIQAVERVVDEGPPRTSTYSLTETGRRLAEAAAILRDLGDNA